MKRFTILYILTIYLLAYVCLSDYSQVFAQQDSNSVVTETKSVQDTLQKNINSQDSSQTKFLEEVSIDRIRNLISFEKIIGSYPSQSNGNTKCWGVSTNFFLNTSKFSSSMGLPSYSHNDPSRKL